MAWLATAPPSDGGGTAGEVTLGAVGYPVVGYPVGGGTGATWLVVEMVTLG